MDTLNYAFAMSFDQICTPPCSNVASRSIRDIYVAFFVDQIPVTSESV